MILKGSQRGGARQLAIHLLKTEENEHVEVHELSGFVSEDLDGALREIYAISQGTRCRQFMFSLSLNPPQRESVPIEYFEKALSDIEKDLNLTGQPRAVVFHEKEGRRHCHAVWSRIDCQEMKAINLPYFKMKLQDISRQLYLEHGWQMPRGLLNPEHRNPLNFTLQEWQQAKRLKEDPRLIKHLFQDCWAVSDNKASFEKALNDYGYYLARGDKRGFVVLDYRGEVYSLSRWMGVKTKELKARLGGPESLPDIQEVKAHIARRMTKTLESYIEHVQTHMEKKLEPFIQQKTALQARQRSEREDLKRQQQERKNREEKDRIQRMPKGIKAFWFRITGKYQKLRKRNQRETERCKIRDREEKQAEIDRHLTQRQDLQDQVKPIRRKHQRLEMQLKRDIGRYMEMGRSNQDSIQDKLDQMNREDQKQKSRSHGRGYDQEM
ncbi:MAG: hypothetical protein NPIRA01_09920 [Nitrospirales bacterium]|nr:MAG: hypothetical protein NPIRA01_09920 [Nitrospirales bacterium]